MEIFSYLLKANVAIAILYLMYILFYRRDTFFLLRRFLLPGMFCLSAVYPFLHFPQRFMHSRTVTGVATAWMQYLPETVAVSPGAAAPNPYSPENCALAVYAAVAGILLAGLVFKSLRIVRIRLRCRTVTVEKTRVCLLENSRAPFSFFRWIFLDPEMHSPPEIREIIAHERVHARQLHSIDVLFAETACALCWINPLAWLLKNEIRRNLEFLVDSRVVRGGVDPKSYQYHLLRRACSPSATAIVNQFNILILKERIRMLNTKQSPKIKLTAYMLLLPLAALLLAANNAGAVIRNLPEVNRATGVSPARTGVQENVIRGKISDRDGHPLAGVRVAVRNTDRNAVTDVNGEFVLPAAADGVLVCSLAGYETAEVRTGGEQRLNIVLQPAPEPSEEAVAVAYGTLPESGPAGDGGGLEPVAEERIHEAAHALTPLMIVNGTVVTSESVETINPQAIDNITILKNGAAEKYLTARGIAGENGTANGVVLITTRNRRPAPFRWQGSGRKGIVIHKAADTPEPLIIVDGTAVPDKSLENMNPQTIESITVLKDDVAKKYVTDQGIAGESGAANGVVLITTKKDPEKKAGSGTED
ncbi:MAG: carboxypeptidase-like regulatory domain-containing protein [Tannerella sp.]|jgi:hypothetical protein|nr:carboxypeptidase-like regulatory domain-containing protein [Tannerella sp.]